MPLHKLISAKCIRISLMIGLWKGLNKFGHKRQWTAGAGFFSLLSYFESHNPKIRSCVKTSNTGFKFKTKTLQDALNIQPISLKKPNQTQTHKKPHTMPPKKKKFTLHPFFQNKEHQKQYFSSSQKIHWTAVWYYN